MGIVRDPLLDFISSKKDETDIFCFQEILNGGEEEAIKMWGTEQVKEHKLLSLATEILSDHTPYYYAHLGDFSGLTIFVRKNVEVLNEGEVWVYGSKGQVRGVSSKFSPRNLQHVTILVGDSPVTVINFHGLWSGGGKEDNEERLLQSKNIVDFMKGLENRFLICGDFNLEPNTESIKMLEDFGLRNLIKEYGITSTRTSYYTKPVRFADYTLVSEGIKVNDFQVLPDEVSDHSPMFLDFE